MVSHMDPFNQLNNYKPKNSRVKPVCSVCNNETLRYAHCYKCGKIGCFNSCLTYIIQGIYDSFPDWFKTPDLLGKRVCNNCLPPMKTAQKNSDPADKIFSELFGNK